MKASELIVALQELVRHHGDLPVFSFLDYDEAEIAIHEGAEDGLHPECIMITR